LGGLATERANSSLFPRSAEVFSQNAALPVAFSANDGAERRSLSQRRRASITFYDLYNLHAAKDNYRSFRFTSYDNPLKSEELAAARGDSNFDQE
jgi:hypothetical protein